LVQLLDAVVEDCFITFGIAKHLSVCDHDRQLR